QSSSDTLGLAANDDRMSRFFGSWVTCHTQTALPGQPDLECCQPELRMTGEYRLRTCTLCRDYNRHRAAVGVIFERRTLRAPPTKVFVEDDSTWADASPEVSII